MSFELVLTSVPKGLKPGSRGFASVAFTEGMPANYVQVCESLSGYVHVFDPQDSKYSQNPVGYSHLVTSTGGRTFSILSRIAAYGTDYTGRTNKLAHHLMLGEGERPSCGPAFAMSNGRIFFSEWKDPPKFLATDRLKPSDVAIPSLRAVQWEKAYGDAGMAGVLAQSFLDAPDRPSFLIFKPGMDLLPLLAEAQALLPPEKYWDVTFSTYFTALPVGMNCAWRCCLRDSDALVTARRIPNALVIDLVERKIISGSLPANDSLALAARTGERPTRPENAPSPQPQAEEISIQATSAKEIARPNPRRITLKPDYTGAFRPIAPTTSKRKRSSIGLILGGVSLIIIAGVALSFMFSPPKERQEAAPNEEPSTQTNQMEVAAILPVQTEAQEQTAEPKPETTLPTQASVPEKGNDIRQEVPAIAVAYEHKVGLSYDIGTAPEVTFWDTAGEEKKGTKKGPTTPEGTSYRPPGSSMSEPNLARHSAAKGLSEISKDVAFLKIDSTNEHVILFVSEANIRCKLTSQQDSFILEFPAGSGGDILLKCIESEKIRITAKLMRRGEEFPASAIKEGEGVLLSISDKYIGRWKVQVISAETFLKTAQDNQAQLSGARTAVDDAGKAWAAACSNKTQSANARTTEMKKPLQLKAIEEFNRYINNLVPAAVIQANQYLEARTRDNYSNLMTNAQGDWRPPDNSAVQNQLDKTYEMAQNFNSVENDVRLALDQNEARIKAELIKANSTMKSAGDLKMPDKVQILLDNQSIVSASKPSGN